MAETLLPRSINKNSTGLGIYGIKRDITSIQPEWQRTDDAVGLISVAQLEINGNVLIQGHSDFDNIYPWSGIKKVKINDDDTKIMVRIPKFYYQRQVANNIETIRISGIKRDGFVLHPAFARNDYYYTTIDNNRTDIFDEVYVGAYEATNNGTAAPILLQSTIGKTPVGQTVLKSREYANNCGAGFGIMDIATWSAIQMLILVEFANNCVQRVIGKGRSYNASSYGYYTTGVTNPGNGNLQVNYHTGASPDSNSLSGSHVHAVKWRYLENLWGNMGTGIDGMVLMAGTYYYENNPQRYDNIRSHTSQLFTAALDPVCPAEITHPRNSGAPSWLMMPFGKDSTIVGAFDDGDIIGKFSFRYGSIIRLPYHATTVYNVFVGGHVSWNVMRSGLFSVGAVATTATIGSRLQYLNINPKNTTFTDV